MIEVVAMLRGRWADGFALAHGADPAAELARRGWSGSPVSATRSSSDDLRITYAVRPTRPAGDTVPAARVEQDEGLGTDEVSGAVPHQRVAAYAVVRSSRGILLTELSARTNAEGMWNLPGGGLDPGEEPAVAVVREVHEETGQRVTDVRLLTVLTRHWVGRAPSGRVEDFHAVRLFHTAHCPEPGDPVVLDVGGSTSAARWVRETELASLPLASSVPQALAVAGVPAEALNP
ncbi:NUDIX hydrolase [Knoellia sp. CPCC 206435]|uniref:NUDIX hydrolase n=1 Tax=Knoellia terrae TaxID=3404797 RepID=UPI003B435DD7